MAGSVRTLTSSEVASVQSGWRFPLRILLWLEGVEAIVCAGLAFRSEPRWVFASLAAIGALLWWATSKCLLVINRDLENGIAEDIIGSIQKDEKGILDVAAAPFGPGPRLFAEIGRDMWRTFTPGNSPLQVLIGARVLLVGPGLSLAIRVDRETYTNVGDGELVKATVLPQTKVAVRLRHVSIAGD